jgi:hypothetical protein
LTNTTYYELCSTGLALPVADPAWASRVLGNEICKDCLHPIAGKLIPPICLETLPQEDISMVGGFALGLMSTKLAQVFERFSRDSLVFGDVFDCNGARIPFVSFVGINQSWIRGEAGSTLRTCKHCGRKVYFPVGDWYLLKEQLPTYSVTESELHQITVTQAVLADIDLAGLRGVIVEKLEIKDRPLDGFPAVL